MKRLIFTLVVTAAGFALLFSGSVRAVSISGVTTTQVSTSQEAVSWSTDVSTMNDILRYGLNPPTFSSTASTIGTGWANKPNIEDIAFDSSSSWGYLVARSVAGTDWSTLFQTTDNGATWHEAPGATNGYLSEPAKAIVFDSAGLVYAAGNSARIRVYDEGSGNIGFYNCNNIPQSITDVLDLKLVGSDLWIVGNKNYLYKSNLGTCVLNTITPGFNAADNAITRVAAYDSQHIWVIGQDPSLTRADVSVTTDGGASWTTTTLQPVTASLVALRDIVAVAADEAYAVGMSGWVYHYKAGTWTSEQLGAGYDFSAVTAMSPKFVYAFGYGLNSKDFVAFTRDGEHWTGIQQMSTSTTVTAAASKSTTSAVLGGPGEKLGQFSFGYASSLPFPSGTTHASVLNSLPRGAAFHAAAESYDSGAKQFAESGEFLFTTLGLAFSSGPTVVPQATSATLNWGTNPTANNNRVHVSRGQTWKKTTISGAANVVDISANGDTAYVAGQGPNVVARSTDLNQNWTTTFNAPNVSMTVFMQGTYGWTAGYNFIDRTIDGTTWQQQYSGGDTFTSIYGFDRLHAWAAGTNGIAGQGYITRTSDGGTTWSKWDVPGATTIWLYDVTAADANTVVAVGTSNKIFRSTDGGVTWFDVSPSASSTTYRSVSMADSTHGWAVGTNGVIVETTDAGKTWAQVFTGCVSNTVSLNGISAIPGTTPGSYDVWIVGSQGTVKRWTGGSGCSSLNNVPAGHGFTSGNNLNAVDNDGRNVWIAGESGLVARYGIDTTAGSYFTATDAANSASHSASVVGLTPLTTYNYFAQSTDSSGFTATAGGTFTTLSQPELDVSPTSMSFSAVQGQTAAVPSQTISVRDKTNPALNIGAWTATNVSGDSWLQFTPASAGTTPGTITVTPVVTGLAQGTYTGSISIDLPGAAGSPKIVSVTLTIQPRPRLVLSSTNVSFQAQEGDATNPAPIAVDVTNGAAGSALTYDFQKANPSASTWLTVSSNGGIVPYTTPSRLTFSVDISKCQPGGNSPCTFTGSPYTETVTVDGGANADASPQVITVTLTITQAPTLKLTPGPNPTLTFTATERGADPAAQTVDVRNDGGGTMGWTVSKSATWFDATPASGSNGGGTSTLLTIQPHTGTLGPQTWNGTVTVNAGTAGSQTITVQFTISPAPVFSVDWTEKPNPLEISTPMGTNPSADRTIRVQSGAATWSASVQPGSAWLTLPGTTSGSTYPSDVSVHVDVLNPNALSVGRYDGTITFTSPGANPSSINIPIILRVTQPPILSVDKTVLNFQATQGQDTILPQSFTISNSGVGTLAWTIDQPSGTWAKVTTTSCTDTYNNPISGGAPSTVNVCVDVINPTLLVPQTYTTTITITAPGALQSPKQVTVNLNVQPDTTGPQLAVGSFRIETGATCPGAPFARVIWQTDEYGDSEVHWTDIATDGVPEYSLGVINDPVDTVNHTGGTKQHTVILENLIAGHLYYVKFRSTDRYGNPTDPNIFVDHDPNNPSLLITFRAPVDCDDAPPTDILLTVPPSPIYGTPSVNMSAKDESGVDNFKLFVDASSAPITTVGSPLPGTACLIDPSDPTKYLCRVTYSLNSTLLSDGTHTLTLEACDLNGNCARSEGVTVTVNNAAPVVSNVRAENVQSVNGQWQATIRWDTDIVATALVDYGVEDENGSFSYTNRKTGDDAACANGLNHCATITNLIGDRIYHYQVTSCSLLNPTMCDH